MPLLSVAQISSRQRYEFFVDLTEWGNEPFDRRNRLKTPNADKLGSSMSEIVLARPNAIKILHQIIMSGVLMLLT